MDRRHALQLVGCLLATDRRGDQVPPKPLTRRIVLNPLHEERLEIDFGAGAYAVKTIRLQQGAISLDIPVSDLLAALGARTSGAK